MASLFKAVRCTVDNVRLAADKMDGNAGNDTDAREEGREKLSIHRYCLLFFSASCPAFFASPASSDADRAEEPAVPLLPCSFLPS